MGETSKMKLTKKKMTELMLAHAEYNKRQKSLRLGDPVSFDEYLDIINGKKKVEYTSNEIPSYDCPRPTPHYPSCSDKSVGTAQKPEPKKYSGERKLVGIGTMHKSNLVPIFSDEEAEDIANMRRN